MYKYVQYLAEYNKTYEKQDVFLARFDRFIAINEKIQEHNQDPNNTSTVGHNQFSDWTLEELGSLTSVKQVKEAPTSLIQTPVDIATDSIDWRNHDGKNYVTPVMDNGSIAVGASSIVSLANITSAHAIVTGTLTYLSMEQVLACFAYKMENPTCDEIFQYVENAPLETEEDYPVPPKTSEAIVACAYDPSKGLVKVLSINDVTPNQPDQLKAALLKGPVAAIIEADEFSFQMYSGGIITGTNCGTMPDHDILIVGFGTDGTTEYFIIQNSWGSDWGESGYAKIGIEEGKGVCGINQSPSYPTTN